MMGDLAISAVVYAKLRALTKKSDGGSSTATRLGGVETIFADQKLVKRDTAQYLRTGAFVPEKDYPGVPDYVQRVWMPGEVTIPVFPETPYPQNWTYGNGVTIISTNTPNICWVSNDDRKTFTKVTLPDGAWTIVFGGGRFVGLCRSSGATGCTFSITSLDGVNWTKWEQGKSLKGFDEPFVYADGVWLAVNASNASNAVWRSEDNGETWTLIVTQVSSPYARSVAGWCNGIWYLAGYAGTPTMSLDKGLTWVSTPSFYAGRYQSQWASIGDVIVSVRYESPNNLIYIRRQAGGQWYNGLASEMGVGTIQKIGVVQSVFATPDGWFVIVFTYGGLVSKDMGKTWIVYRTASTLGGWLGHMEDKTYSLTSGPWRFIEAQRQIGTSKAVKNQYMRIA